MKWVWGGLLSSLQIHSEPLPHASSSLGFANGKALAGDGIAEEEGVGVLSSSRSLCKVIWLGTGPRGSPLNSLSMFCSLGP